jgi:hypothetical protein
MVGVFLAVGTSLLANAAKGACRRRQPSGLLGLLLQRMEKLNELPHVV